MALILRQSTAVDVLIGPFLDETDATNSEEAETPVVLLSKNGQALAAKNDATVPVHDDGGYYNCELDTTDTNTVGTLVLVVEDSANALPVRHEFQVVEEATYDFLYASGATPIADINAEADTALSDYDPPTKAELDSGLAALNDLSAAQVNAEADTALSDYDGPTKAEMDTGHGLLATEAKQDTIDTVVDAIKAVTDLLPDAGALSDLATILADTGELQTDWANGGRLDLLVDAIKAVTDLLPDAGALNDLAAILVDTGTTLQAELDGIQADTEDIQTRLPAALSAGGYMKSDLQTWLEGVPAALSSTYVQSSIAFIGGNAIGPTAHAQTAIDRIVANIMLTTTATTEAVGSTRRTLYEVIAGLTHKREISGTDILLYKADDSTVLATVPITTDSGQDPISSIDPPA